MQHIVRRSQHNMKPPLCRSQPHLQTRCNLVLPMAPPSTRGANTHMAQGQLCQPFCSRSLHVAASTSLRTLKEKSLYINVASNTPPQPQPVFLRHRPFTSHIMLLLIFSTRYIVYFSHHAPAHLFYIIHRLLLTSCSRSFVQRHISCTSHIMLPLKFSASYAPFSGALAHSTSLWRTHMLLMPRLINRFITCPENATEVFKMLLLLATHDAVA